MLLFTQLSHRVADYFHADFSIGRRIRENSFDMAHWFDLMNDEGWIPRENILGSEARVRLPDEFVVQRNNQGNQPTFFLVLDANMFKTSLLVTRAFLARISEPDQQTKSSSSSYHIRNFFVKIDLAVRGEKLLNLRRIML